MLRGVVTGILLLNLTGFSQAGWFGDAVKSAGESLGRRGVDEAANSAYEGAKAGAGKVIAGNSEEEEASANEAEEAEEEPREGATAAASRQSPSSSLAQPSEAELGVPVYPGAKYDARNSAGMSQDDRYHWLFITADPIGKVVAFYEGKTRLTPSEMSGSYIFTLKKGDSPYFPDHGVTIEKNTMFQPPIGTVVSVTKVK